MNGPLPALGLAPEPVPEPVPNPATNPGTPALRVPVQVASLVGHNALAVYPTPAVERW